MIEIIFSGMLYFPILAIGVLAIKKQSVSIALCSFVYFILILTMAVTNYHFGWIEQKFASTFSYERYLGIETHLNSNFTVQGYFTAPAFMLTNAWEAAIGVNVAIVAALALLSDKLRWPYLLIFFSPAVLHIAIFALRDVILAATILITCQFMFGHKKPNILYAIPLFSLIYLQRPEIVGILALALTIIYFKETNKYFKLPVIIISTIGIIFVLPYAPLLLGVQKASSLLNLIDVILVFFESRANRGIDIATTPILGGNLTQIPFLIRYPLQLWVFFFSPWPTDFRSGTSLVFVADSIFYVAVFVMFWKRCDRQHKIFLLTYIFANALFMSNYGNMLRLRMPCYFIMMSGFCRWGHKMT